MDILNQPMPKNTMWPFFSYNHLVPLGLTVQAIHLIQLGKWPLAMIPKHPLLNKSPVMKVKTQLFKLSIIISIIYYSPNLRAQCSGDIVISSQAQIDSWICTLIAANTLTISGNDITNLDGLSILVNSVGILDLITIQDNPLLTDVSGLSNFGHVPEVMKLKNNAVLTDVSMLFLHSRDSTIIENNPNLLSLDNLNGGTSQKTTYIINNDELQDLVDLGPQGQDSIYIIGNDALTDISAFSSANYLPKLVLSDNQSLKNLGGLQNMNTIDKFEISENDSLVDINALNNLSSITQKLSIHNNPMLHQFCPLSNALVNNIPTMSDIYNNLLNPTVEQIAYEGPCDTFRIKNSTFSTFQEALDDAVNFDVIYLTQDYQLDVTPIYNPDKKLSLYISPGTQMTIDGIDYQTELFTINHGIIKLVNNGSLCVLGHLLHPGFIITN